MKLITKVILALTICLVANLQAKKQSFKNPLNAPAYDSNGKLYNQKDAFPNQFEAATNSTNLEFSNYTAPFMSKVLFEEDPKRKLRKFEFVQALRFNSYRLTKGEAEQIFGFADGNKDDLIDSAEWDVFTTIYILPFEACDKDRDYMLNESEFAECFEKDPRSRSIVFRRRYNDNKHSQIMWALTSRAKPLLNIHDYLFMRRGLFAWRNCQSSSKFMSKGSFKCALRTAVLQKLHYSGDIEQIYDVAINITNDLNLIQLDFVAYLRSIYTVYLFTVFGHPTSTAFIERTNFLQAVRDDRLPSNFEEQEVNYLYDLININPLNPNTQMNYASFAFFMNLHKLFNRYSVEYPLQLTKSEFLKLMNDNFFPKKFVQSIDASMTNFTDVEYQEASLILNRKRPDESDYFYSFKQDASENTASLWNASTVNNTYYIVSENMESREFFFNAYSQLNKLTWTKYNYYKAMQIANLYVSLVPDIRFLVPVVTVVDNLMAQYNIVSPPINYKQRQNYPQYRFLPRESSLDLLSFSAIENWREKLQSIVTTSQSLVYESFVKMVLLDFGMRNLPDTVLDLAKKGFDNLRRRTYDPEELMKNAFTVHVVAAENRKNKSFIEKYQIKKNHETSRLFPNANRRAQASPYV